MPPKTSSAETVFPSGNGCEKCLETTEFGSIVANLTWQEVLTILVSCKGMGSQVKTSLDLSGTNIEGGNVALHQSLGERTCPIRQKLAVFSAKSSSQNSDNLNN